MTNFILSSSISLRTSWHKNGASYSFVYWKLVDRFLRNGIVRLVLEVRIRSRSSLCHGGRLSQVPSSYHHFYLYEHPYRWRIKYESLVKLEKNLRIHYPFKWSSRREREKRRTEEKRKTSVKLEKQNVHLSPLATSKN